jgi:DNA-binding PadR family transcriptional regulator
LSSDRLNPFSYVILTLVGRRGAGPHDLRRNAEQGRVFWEAAPSQWYAEPKRLAKLGYLTAEKLPGRTRERTHYTLTDSGREALAEWVRTPAPLPRIQNAPIVRFLAADLVPAEELLAGLEALRNEIDEQLELLDEAPKRWERTAPHRIDVLNVNVDWAKKSLRLQLEWLDEAERTLTRRRA